MDAFVEMSEETGWYAEKKSVVQAGDDGRSGIGVCQDEEAASLDKRLRVKTNGVADTRSSGR